MSSKYPLTEAFTKMASDYEMSVDAELHRFWGWSYQEFVDNLFKDGFSFDNEIVLDIATGTGVIPDRIAWEGSAQVPVHGLDITMAMLAQARSRFARRGIQDRVALVCASGMEMPYANGSFTHIICGLATHHMTVERLLLESHRLLRIGGRLTLTDAGSAPLWNIPGVKLLLKVAAFVYFSLTEGLHRAWIEADAVSNVRLREQWLTMLEKTGFSNVEVVVLKSRHAWISAPFFIKAVKC
jgi:ubiquinone/menaquinone biosynthesis C-methylase UbiE